MMNALKTAQGQGAKVWCKGLLQRKVVDAGQDYGKLRHSSNVDPFIVGILFAQRGVD